MMIYDSRFQRVADNFLVFAVFLSTLHCLVVTRDMYLPTPFELISFSLFNILMMSFAQKSSLLVILASITKRTN